jgi:hypothetical protein
MIVVMEIIYKNNSNKSNFEYCSDIFKNKSILNGFNKLDEDLLMESVTSKEFIVRDVKFDEEIKGKLYICYPLSVVVENDIKFNSLHSLISEIRKTYKEIYKNPIKYGIWGHSIYDLVIEGIGIYDGNLVKVSIGS